MYEPIINLVDSLGDRSTFLILQGMVTVTQSSILERSKKKPYLDCLANTIVLFVR